MEFCFATNTPMASYLSISIVMLNIDHMHIFRYLYGMAGCLAPLQPPPGAQQVHWKLGDGNMKPEQQIDDPTLSWSHG
jgi:hypothetical protein